MPQCARTFCLKRKLIKIHRERETGRQFSGNANELFVINVNELKSAKKCLPWNGESCLFLFLPKVDRYERWHFDGFCINFDIKFEYSMNITRCWTSMPRLNQMEPYAFEKSWKKKHLQNKTPNNMVFFKVLHILIYFEYISISIMKSIESVRFLCLHASACVCVCVCVLVFLSIDLCSVVRNAVLISRDLWQTYNDLVSVCVCDRECY